MRSEYLSGLVIGPGIWRSPVRFPASRRSFRVHFEVIFSSTWDVLGCVWEWLRDVFGWVWDDFEKISGGAEKYIFSKIAGSIFLSRAA